MGAPVTQSPSGRADTLDRVVCGVVCALAGAYLVARAIWVPLTYDEAASLVRYVRGDVGALLDFGVATNHLLNSVLTRLSHAVFGDAPWALRCRTSSPASPFWRWRRGWPSRRASGPSASPASCCWPPIPTCSTTSRSAAATAGHRAGHRGARVAAALERRAAAAPARGPAAAGARLDGAGRRRQLLDAAGVPGGRRQRHAALLWTARGSRLTVSTSIPGWSTDAIVAWASSPSSTRGSSSREPALSPELFAPVTVEVAGLLPAGAAIAVYHVNRRGRPMAFARATTGHGTADRDATFAASASSCPWPPTTTWRASTSTSAATAFRAPAGTAVRGRPGTSGPTAS